MAYEKISETVAEKTETVERKVRITLKQAEERVNFLRKALTEAEKVVEDLKILGLK